MFRWFSVAGPLRKHSCPRRSADGKPVKHNGPQLQKKTPSTEILAESAGMLCGEWLAGSVVAWDERGSGHGSSPWPCRSGQAASKCPGHECNPIRCGLPETKARDVVGIWGHDLVKYFVSSSVPADRPVAQPFLRRIDSTDPTPSCPSSPPTRSCACTCAHDKV